MRAGVVDESMFGNTRKLRRHGSVLVASPERFLVTGPGRLPGEEARGAAWGRGLASKVTTRQAA